MLQPCAFDPSIDREREREREANDKRIILIILITRSRRSVVPDRIEFRLDFFLFRKKFDLREWWNLEDGWKSWHQLTAGEVLVRISGSAVATVACFQASCEPSCAGRRGRQKLDDGRRLEIEGKRSKAIIDRRSFSRGLSSWKGRRRERPLHCPCFPPAVLASSGVDPSKLERGNIINAA